MPLRAIAQINKLISKKRIAALNLPDLVEGEFLIFYFKYQLANKWGLAAVIQQPQLRQEGIAVLPRDNSFHCPDCLNSAVRSSVAVDLASRRSRRFVATLVPVQIVLRLHHLLGFISLLWLRLVQCVKWDT